MADNTDSPLLGLPPELRNNIYELVFADHIIDFNTKATRNAPSILLSCKQIYAEAVTVYYAEATFVSNEVPEDFTSHIQKLPTRFRKSLRNVVLSNRDEALSSPCANYPCRCKIKPVSCIYEAVELTNLAIEYQTRFWEFEYRLKKQCLPQTAARLNTNILLDYSPKVIHTRTPWQTFCARFVGEQMDEEFCQHLSQFFDRKHGWPLACWVEWVEHIGSRWKCDCPPVSNTADNKEQGSSEEIGA